jgi:hypothetical protein
MKIKTYSHEVKLEGLSLIDEDITKHMVDAIEKKIKEHIEHFEREAFWAILEPMSEFKATPPVIVHRCGGSNTGTMTDRYRCSRCNRKPPTEIISTYKMLYLRNP